VAADLPGYGASPSIEPYDIAGLAGAVEALVAHVGAARTVLVGHSMGGMVAMELAVRSPQCLHGLVLSGASPAFGKPGGTWQQQFIQERFAPLDAGQGMAALAARLVAGMVAPGTVGTVVDIATALMAAVPEATYRQALTALVSFERRAALPRLALPVLCIAGAHDRNATPAVVQQMALRIPGAEYIGLPTAGHLAAIEAPQAFNRALLGFLGRHFSPAV
jgi:3-oxoadipate enol-lactonase